MSKKRSPRLTTVQLEYPEHLVSPQNNLADFIYEVGFCEDWEECGLNTEVDLWQFESVLTSFPESGVVMRGAGGLRKLRWNVRGTGKSGGIRVIYQWIPEIFIFYVYLAYRKTELDNLSLAVRKQLKGLAEENRDRLLKVYG